MFGPSLFLEEIFGHPSFKMISSANRVRTWRQKCILIFTEKHPSLTWRPCWCSCLLVGSCTNVVPRFAAPQGLKLPGRCSQNSSCGLRQPNLQNPHPPHPQVFHGILLVLRGATKDAKRASKTRSKHSTHSAPGPPPAEAGGPQDMKRHRNGRQLVP